MQRPLRAGFANAADVEVGQPIGLEIAQAEEMPGTAIKGSDTAVGVNFSHLPVSHDLIIDMEILDVTRRP